MTQTLFYWVEDDGESCITDEQWQAIERLQQRTNLLEYLHRGRVGMVRFTYEPRWPELFADSALPAAMDYEQIARHIQDLLDRGWTWEDLVRLKLATRLPGGLFDSDCLLAGQSEVSDLRGDVTLVMRFILKASTIAPDAIFHVSINGDVVISELLVQNGHIWPDQRAAVEQLDGFRRAGNQDDAIALLEALESGEWLTRTRRQGHSGV